jgi:hypothetical protein
MSKAQQTMVDALLYSAAFADYKAIGNVGLGNLDTVTKILDKFGVEIELKKQGNGFIVTDCGEAKTVILPLFDEGLFDKNLKAIQIKHENNFVLSSDTLKSIIDDVSFNKDVLMTMITKDNAVVFTNTGEFVFERTIETPTIKTGTKVEFGSALVEATSALKGTMLEISIKTDFPAKIEEKTEDSLVTYIVTPYTKTEE